MTDDEGKYEFRDLIPAEYFVSVAAKPWYATRPGWENRERSANAHGYCGAGIERGVCDGRFTTERPSKSERRRSR